MDKDITVKIWKDSVPNKKPAKEENTTLTASLNLVISLKSWIDTRTKSAKERLRKSIFIDS